ncbi:MAG: hypothetical protein V3W22_02280 [Thermoplasmata archaeon]
MKAGGIFLLSLGMAAVLGLAFSVLSPNSECSLPVSMSIESSEGGLRAVVTSVEGEFDIDEVEYRIVQLREGSFTVVMEGSLTSALSGAEGVVYHHQDPAAGVLEVGDYLTIDGAEEGTQVILMTLDETALGWTVGCEG